MSVMWMFLALLYMFFDVAYYLRGFLLAVFCHIWRMLYTAKLLETSTYHGICLTTDLDFMFHMNNARYLREADFGRFEMWLKNGMYDVVKKLGAHITLGASTIRYRKSIELFDVYSIQSRILCWDDRAFYVEQKFVHRDGFIMAVMLAKQTLVNLEPQQAVLVIDPSIKESPLFPEEVTAWVNYNSLSSQVLKKDL